MVVPGALYREARVVEDGVGNSSSKGGEGTSRVNANKASGVYGQTKMGAKAGISSMSFLEEGVKLIPELGHAMCCPVAGSSSWGTLVRAALGQPGEILGHPHLPRSVIGGGEQVPKEFEVIGLLPSEEGGAIEAAVHKGGF